MEIYEEIEYFQRKLDRLSNAKKSHLDIGYVAEDVALRDKMKLLKWILGEE
jgi:hypothetical protein